MGKLEVFIEKANIVHGNRYDYSNVSINNPLKRIHKFNFRKKILNKKYGLDLNMSETDMVKSIGYTKIWNCGLFKYVWKKEG